jgi:hypothetical protein
MNSYQKCIDIEKQFPKIKNYINESDKKKCAPTNNFEIDSAFSYFDPNIAASPPNDFMSNLEKRMATYYTKK